MRRHARCRTQCSFVRVDGRGWLPYPFSILSRPCAAISAGLILLSSRSRGSLLAGDGLGRSLAGPRVSVGALAANRQPLAVTQSAIAAEIHQPLDIELNFAPQIALDHVIAVDDLANLEYLGIRELRHAPLGRQINLAHDILGDLGPDAMDVLQRDHHALVGRQIDTRDTSHLASPISTGGAERAKFSCPSNGIAQSVTRRPCPLCGGPASRQTSECRAYWGIHRVLVWVRR